MIRNQYTTALKVAGCLARFLAAGRAPAANGHAAPAVYGRPPTLEDVVISPDGGRLGSVRTDDDQRDLIVMRLQDGHAAKVRLGDAMLEACGEFLQKSNPSD